MNTIGSGNFGILRGVIVCVGLIYPLVSVNYLTKILGYHIFFSHNRAYILDISSKTNDSGHTDFRIVTTATVSNITGLYQLDNPSDFLIERQRRLPTGNHPKSAKRISTSLPNLVPTVPAISDSSKSDNTVEPQKNIPKKPKLELSPSQIVSGSSKSNPKSVRGSFSILQWLHIRLGHASKEAILSMVRNGSVIGSGATIEELGRTNRGFTAMHVNMVACTVSQSLLRLL